MKMVLVLGLILSTSFSAMACGLNVKMNQETSPGYNKESTNRSSSSSYNAETSTANKTPKKY